MHIAHIPVTADEGSPRQYQARACHQAGLDVKLVAARGFFGLLGAAVHSACVCHRKVLVGPRCSLQINKQC